MQPTFQDKIKTRPPTRKIAWNMNWIKFFSAKKVLKEDLRIKNYRNTISYNT
jgi:hypothetical protein